MTSYFFPMLVFIVASVVGSIPKVRSSACISTNITIHTAYSCVVHAHVCFVIQWRANGGMV